MENITKYVANKIKEFREQKGITQQELAEAINTTQQSVARYESGERKADQNVLFALAEYFKTSINSFFPEIDTFGDEFISEDMSQDYITVSQLSILSGIKLDELNEILDGKTKLPKPSYLYKIANALHTDFYTYFIGYGYVEDPQDRDNELFNTGIRYLLSVDDKVDLCKYLAEYWNQNSKTEKFNVRNIYETLFSDEKEKKEEEIKQIYNNLNNNLMKIWSNKKIKRDIIMHKSFGNDELSVLFSKNKDYLTEEDKEYIKFIIEKRKREIDKQLGEDNAS